MLDKKSFFLNSTLRTKYIVQFTIYFVLLFYASLITNCTSTIRYSRSESRVENGRLYVTPKWDYRKNYQLPTSKLKSVIDSYLGVRYKSGGSNRNGFDCSGFVCTVFKEVNRANLPRSSRKLQKVGYKVSPQSGRMGDIVIFTSWPIRVVNHVGIYMGNDIFAHASSSKGVTYSNLNDEYYKKRFLEIRRLF